MRLFILGATGKTGRALVATGGTNISLMCPVSDYPEGRGVWKLSVEFVPDKD